MVPNAVDRSEDPEAHLVVQVVVARSVDLAALLAEVVGAAAEVARTLSTTFSRRLKAAFFCIGMMVSAIAVYVGLVEV